MKADFEALNRDSDQLDAVPRTSAGFMGKSLLGRFAERLSVHRQTWKLSSPRPFGDRVIHLSALKWGNTALPLALLSCSTVNPLGLSLCARAEPGIIQCTHYINSL